MYGSSYVAIIVFFCQAGPLDTSDNLSDQYIYYIAHAYQNNILITVLYALSWSKAVKIFFS